MTVTPQQQVTADANAMQQARDSLNDANNVVTASALTAPQKIKVHTALATVAGILQTAEAVAKAWITANPPPVTPPPTPPSSHLFGISSINDMMWTAPNAYPVSQLTTLEVKVVRSQLAMDANGWAGYCGTMSYPLTAKARTNVQAWTKAMRAAGIQPLIVCTFATLQDTPTMVAAMSALATDNPGTWWEWGNELEYQAQGITAAAYVAQFRSIVTTLLTVDPSAKIGPAPVENITKGQQGWSAETARAAAGLFSIPFHFLPFHCYGDTAPICEALIAPWIAYTKSLGNVAPNWLTEWGWNSSQTTLADQSNQCVAFAASSAVQALAVALAYELEDDDPIDWGWTSAGYVPKPVFTAFATRS